MRARNVIGCSRCWLAALAEIGWLLAAEPNCLVRREPTSEDLVGALAGLPLYKKRDNSTVWH